jgi:myosin heavy subunit
MAALRVIDFSEEEIDCIFRIVAAILHLGNVSFRAKEDGSAVPVSSDHVKHASLVSVTLMMNVDECSE